MYVVKIFLQKDGSWSEYDNLKTPEGHSATYFETKKEVQTMLDSCLDK